jgi:hypothetical protein
MVSRIWNEVIVTYLKVLPWHFHAETEENHKNPVRIDQLRFRKLRSEYKSALLSLRIYDG